jgi:hypothetical protein
MSRVDVEETLKLGQTDALKNAIFAQQEKMIRLMTHERPNNGRYRAFRAAICEAQVVLNNMEDLFKALTSIDPENK